MKIVQILFFSHTAKAHACKIYDEKMAEATDESQPHSDNVLGIIHTDSARFAIQMVSIYNNVFKILYF